MKEMDVGQFAQVLRQAQGTGLCDVETESLIPASKSLTTLAMNHLSSAIQMLVLADMYQTEFLAKVRLTEPGKTNG